MDIHTDRLLLRPIRQDDKGPIFMYRSDPDISRHLSLIPSTEEDVAAFIRKSSSTINEPGTWFQLVIIEKVNRQLIGDIGLHFLDNGTENSQVEIGYTLGKKHQGFGYATEALKAVIHFLFDTLKKRRIIASIDPANEPSIQLIERLGFRKEAHFVESLYFHGRWVDDLIFALLRREWGGDSKENDH